MFKKIFSFLFFIVIFSLSFIFLIHPAAITLGKWQSPVLLLLLALTLEIYWKVVSWNSKPQKERVVVFAGYIMGFSWVCEILMGNLNLHPSIIALNLFYRGPILLVVLTNIAIGFFITLKQKHFLAGLIAGVQSGMMSGLFAIETLVGLIIFALPIQLADVQNKQEFLRSGGADFTAFLVQGYSFAGLNHLWIGLFGGLLLASIGSFFALLLQKAVKYLIK